MKKICFLISDITFRGGAERITISLANRLAEEKDVTILSIAHFESKNLLYEVSPNVKLESLGIKNWGLKGSIRKNYFIIVSLLRRFVCENKINVLINVQANNMLWSVPALIRCKTANVCWEHLNFNSHKSFIYDISILLAKKFAKRIIVLTERDKQLWNSDKVISISNFPDFVIPEVKIDEKQNVFIAVG